MLKSEARASTMDGCESEFLRSIQREQRPTFLVKYALLAPSSHNTQPWKFAVDDDEIRIYSDTARWLRIADPDQRELHISVGCALENLLIAAHHFGFDTHVRYLPAKREPSLIASVALGTRLGPPTFSASHLFDAILFRSTNHNLFKPQPISIEDQQRIHACCVEDGILLHLSGEFAVKERINELIARADVQLFSDPAFREELSFWIGQGVFGTSWLISKLGQLAMPHLDIGRSQAAQDIERARSAPLVGLISSRENDRITQVKVGQVFERIYLTTAVLGIGLQPMSQIVQVPEIKDELVKVFPIENWYPQQPFRIGYAEPDTTHTPRRPIEDVLVFSDQVF